MSKSRKVPEKVERITAEVVAENQQAVNSEQSFAKNEIEEGILNESITEKSTIEKTMFEEKKNRVKRK